MALKPLFQRKPLMDTKKALLPLKQITPQGEVREKMKQLASEILATELDNYALCALTNAAYLLDDEALIGICCAKMDESPFVRGADMPVMDALNMAMAFIPRYERTTDKALLEPMMRLIKSLGGRFDNALLMNPGQAMELILWLYNVTGKKGLLNLAAELRQKALDWTSLLSTFDVVKPFDKLFDIASVEAGVISENGDVAGLNTRRYAMGHGRTLARNLRTPALFALYSGNGKETEASMAGYKKVIRYHGLPGGIFTANPYLSGSNPEKGTGYKAIGELAYSLAVIAQVDSQAFEPLEKIALNVLMAYQPGDRVYALSKDKENRSAGCAPYVLRGLTAYARTAACIYQDGMLAVDLLTDGEYKFRTDAGKIKIHTRLTDDAFMMQIIASEEGKHGVQVRIPAWAGDAYAQIDKEPGLEKDAKGMICIRRSFGKDPTNIAIKLYREKTRHKGYRESEYVEYGPYVMPDDRQC